MSEKLTKTDIANKLISCAVKGGIFIDLNKAYKSFGIQDGISIMPENALEYEESIQKFFDADKDIYRTYTFSSFEKTVAALIRPHVIAETTIDTAGVNKFFLQLKTEKISTYKVFRPIFGINIAKSKTPITLGPYKIYDTKAHADQLKIDMADMNETLLDGVNVHHLVCVNTLARESNKAIEIANALFERFESIMRFILGSRTKRFDVGIIYVRGYSRNSAFVVSEDGKASSYHGQDGMNEPIPIDDAYFVNSGMGFDRIWQCLASTSINEIEKRLLLALEWIGQSLNENAPASAFLKSAIALEVLFTHNEKSLINTSILAQISENVAMLLGTDIQSRQKFEAEVKRLYSLRSSIAHAGNSDVDQADLDAIQNIARQIVVKILTTESLKTITSIADMYKYFKSLKYSCPKIQ